MKGWQRDLLLLLGLGGWCLSLPYRTTVGYKKSHSGSWLMRTPDISTDVLIERRNLWEGHGLAMQRCRHLPSPSAVPASELSHGSSAAAADVPWHARIIWVAHIIDTYDQYVDGSVQERDSSLARGSGKNAELAASQRLVAR